MYGFKANGSRKGIAVTDNGELKISGNLATAAALPDTAAVSSITTNLETSQQLFAADTDRLSAIVSNNTGVNAYILYGTGTASTTNYSFILYDGDSVQIEFAGPAQVICAAGASGRIQVTELA
jgi:hypothetical protein